ncbi:unnamed protein product [Prunus brigantina]
MFLLNLLPRPKPIPFTVTSSPDNPHLPTGHPLPAHRTSQAHPHPNHHTIPTTHKPSSIATHNPNLATNPSGFDTTVFVKAMPLSSLPSSSPTTTYKPSPAANPSLSL